MKTIESSEAEHGKIEAWKIALIFFFITLALDFGWHWIAKTRESTPQMLFDAAAIAGLSYVLNRRDWFD